MTLLVISLFLLLSCNFSSPDNSNQNDNSVDVADLGYPKTWWEDPKGVAKKDWEIFPSEARYPDVVLSKRNELGILSNFAETPIVIDNKKYPCVEAFWQMLKFPEDVTDKSDPRNAEVWQYTREEVATANGLNAKKMGSYANEKMDKLGIDWVTYNGVRIPFSVNERGLFYRLIYYVLVEKIKQNKPAHEILLRTKNLNLLPDHKEDPKSPPAWRYFEIYMDIRKKLPHVLENNALPRELVI